jgi:hypothetical protein
MMLVQDRIILHRGGDLAITAVWTQTVGGVDTAVNLTGETFTPFEVVPAALATGMAITVTDGPAGAFTVTRAWDADWPDGLGAVVSFRGQSGSGTFTIPQITVMLK